MNVKVSIIVPIYNVASYLPACMESLCNQTLADIEIIAINDNSTDNCLDILQNFSKRDRRIKIISNSVNCGTAAARNTGLAVARGQYVSFVDGDDFLDSEFYEKLYSLAIMNDADISKGLTKTLNVDGSVYIATDNDEIKQKGKYAFMGHLLTAIYNRDMLVNHNIKFYIDFFCFQIQAVYFSNKIVCCDDAFYNYVRHAGSCDSDVFSLEKWQRLNLGHANFIYDWVASHPYDENTKDLYLERVKALYFYGFNKLIKSDICVACHILAHTMSNKYDCGFNTKNLKKLSRKLYRKNKKTSMLDYYINILKGQI